MPVGTRLTHYETVGSPQGFTEGRGTPLRSTSTIGMLTVARDTVISNNYKLKVDLTAEVKVEDDRYVVIDYEVDEYGIGNSLEEAQQDLFNSLVDYLVSLERRENRLGPRERNNLQILKGVLAK